MRFTGSAPTSVNVDTVSGAPSVWVRERIASTAPARARRSAPAHWARPAGQGQCKCPRAAAPLRCWRLGNVCGRHAAAAAASAPPPRNPALCISGSAAGWGPPRCRCGGGTAFPAPRFPPPRQRGCTWPRARSRLWSRPACPVSMRRRARHRPEKGCTRRPYFGGVKGARRI